MALILQILITDIASHIIKGDIAEVRRRLLAVPMHSVGISVVTQAEQLYGVAKRGHPQGPEKKFASSWRAWLSCRGIRKPLSPTPSCEHAVKLPALLRRRWI